VAMLELFGAKQGGEKAENPQFSLSKAAIE
jgi:hypothetical protein